jgi:Flp pilus assembly protein TadB
MQIISDMLENIKRVVVTNEFYIKVDFLYVGLITLIFIALSVCFATIFILITQKTEKALKNNNSKLKLFLKRIKDDEQEPEAVKNILLKYQQNDDELPEWVNKWLDQVEKKINQSGIKVISLVKYFLIIVIALFIAALMGAGVLKNPAVTLILMACSFFVPDVILSSYMQKQRLKIIEQLSSATRIFSAEFKETPQVLKALNNTSKRIPSPLKEVFEKAVTDLTVGKDKNEVFDEMMVKLDFDYGQLFVQLLRLAWEDASVQPLFSKLSTKIAELQSLLKKNQSSLAYGRIMGMGVNALIIPTFLAMAYFVPGSYEFMVHNPVGKIIVTMCFLSVLIGLILDRLLNSTRL